MKIELHLLQNFPPSNLNRDDMNEPKDCVFGGHRRARISSQCIKRSIRRSPIFKETLDGKVARRTRRSAELLAQKLTDAVEATPEIVELVSGAVMTGIIGGDIDEGSETNVLYYIGEDELDAIVEDIVPEWEAISAAATDLHEANTQVAQEVEADEKGKASSKATKKATENKGVLVAAIKPIVTNYVKSFSDSVGSVDIALFGRMLAKEPKLNVDAACQVAHAISTNEVKMEYDYYTAVDDLKEETNAQGAGMIGFTGYNSSCFYRYALIDVDLLNNNLGGNQLDLAIDGIQSFIHSAITAIPTGKQNSFAAQTPTVMAFTVVRDSGFPLSLANAFESPARPKGDQSLVQRSVEQLDGHWESATKMYPATETKGFICLMEGMGELNAIPTNGISRVDNVNDLVEKTAQAVRDGYKQ